MHELLAIVLPDKEFFFKSRDARGDQQDGLRQDNLTDGEEIIIQRYRKLKDSAAKKTNLITGKIEKAFALKEQVASFNRKFLKSEQALDVSTFQKTIGEL